MQWIARAAAGGSLAAVVVRHQSAQQYPGTDGELGAGGVEERAADKIEIHVDAIGTVSPQRFGYIFTAAIDAGVVAEVLRRLAALLIGAGDADDTTAGGLGQLTGDGADPACGRGDDHGLSGDGLGQTFKACPGRQTGHTQRRQCQGRLGKFRGQGEHFTRRMH